MEPFEMKKLETARLLLGRMAEGLDPLTVQPVPRDHVFNSPVIVRALCFVGAVLRAVAENQGAVGRYFPKAPLIPFPLEALKAFSYREDLTITRFLRQVCEPVSDPAIARIGSVAVLGWLTGQGYLKEVPAAQEGKRTHLPTEQGRQLGIYTRTRMGMAGEYLAVYYGRAAQEFLVASMDQILKAEREGEPAAPGGGEEKAATDAAAAPAGAEAPAPEREAPEMKKEPPGEEAPEKVTALQDIQAALAAKSAREGEDGHAPVQRRRRGLESLAGPEKACSGRGRGRTAPATSQEGRPGGSPD